MVAIIKSREPANILVSIGGRDSQGCHLDRKLRWVVQYNFYLNAREPHVLETLGYSVEQYKMGSLRYDLSKLRAKTLVEKLPHSRR